MANTIKLDDYNFFKFLYKIDKFISSYISEIFVDIQKCISLCIVESTGCLNFIMVFLVSGMFDSCTADMLRKFIAIVEKARLRIMQTYCNYNYAF